MKQKPSRMEQLRKAFKQSGASSQPSSPKPVQSLVRKPPNCQVPAEPIVKDVLKGRKYIQVGSIQGMLKVPVKTKAIVATPSKVEKPVNAKSNKKRS